MPWQNLKIPLLLFVLFLCQRGLPQGAVSSFPDKVDQILENKPANYTALHKLLQEFSTDTVALNYFQERAEQDNYLEGVVYALNRKGSYYRQIANIDQAVELHTIALNIAETKGKTDLKIISLNKLGLDFRANNAIKGALDYHQEALDIAESIEDPSICVKRSINTAIHGIGDIYQSLEQYDLAINYFRRSLNYEEKLRNSEGIALNYQNIGECLEAIGKLEESLKHYESSLLVNENVGSDRIQVVSNYGIAHIYVHQDKLEDAMERLLSILPMAENLGDHDILSSVYIHLGWTHLRLNELEKANEYLLKGVEIAERYNFPWKYLTGKYLSP